MTKQTNALYRLIYASSIKTEHVSDAAAIDKLNQDILTSAHKNNPSLDINGVLFYGEGYFFQCLEGQKAAVEKLFNVICADDRHEDIMVLLVNYINKRYFGQWSMKFVDNDAAVSAHLKSIGQRFFNPYLFDAHTTSSLIRLFVDIK